MRSCSLLFNDCPSLGGNNILVSANGFFDSGDSIFGFIKGANNLFVSADGSPDGSISG